MNNDFQNLMKVISRLLEDGGTAVVITVMSGTEAIGSKLLVQESGETFGSLGDQHLDTAATGNALTFLQSRDDTRTISFSELDPNFASDKQILLLYERLQPSPRLVVCGAGHVGASLAKLGRFVGYHTTLIDDRDEFVDPTRFPHEQIELVVAQNWGDAVKEAIGNGRGVAVAIVTRGHNEDEECMHAVVATNPDYVGLIGSKRRTNIVIENLRRAGVSEAKLKNIRAPIGLDIGAVTPEEVAMSIIAEIVSERHGREGRSLSAWRRSDDQPN